MQADIQSNKSIFKILGILLLVWLVYAMAGGAGIFFLAVIALIVAVLLSIPPLFWIIFFAVGLAILVFDH